MSFGQRDNPRTDRRSGRFEISSAAKSLDYERLYGRQAIFNAVIELVDQQALTRIGPSSFDGRPCALGNIPAKLDFALGPRPLGDIVQIKGRPQLAFLDERDRNVADGLEGDENIDIVGNTRIRQRIVDDGIFSAVMIMVILTTMATPPTLKWSLSRRDRRRPSPPPDSREATC